MFARIKQSMKSVRSARIIDNGFEKVKTGLSVSPTQMAQMTSKGIPVTSQLAETFFDGTSDPSFEMDLTDLRGIDVNQIWEAEKTARKRLISANQKDIETYG